MNAAWTTPADRRADQGRLGELRHETWYLGRANLVTLLVAIIDDETTLDGAQEAVRHVMSEPWKWYTEFVVARCRELDIKAEDAA